MPVAAYVALIWFTEEVAAIAFTGYGLSGIVLAVRRKVRGQPTEEVAAETQPEDLPEPL